MKNSILYFFAGLEFLLLGVWSIYGSVANAVSGDYGAFSVLFGFVIALVAIGVGLLYFRFFFGKLEVNKLTKFSVVSINLVVFSALIIFVPLSLFVYMFPERGERYFQDGSGFIPIIALLFFVGILSLLTLFFGVVKALKQRKLNQQLTPKSY